MLSHSDQDSSIADASIARAEELYTQAKALCQDPRNMDDVIARRVIELADDAIKEFGSTNQDKKVELRQIKADAEKILPPGTFEELKKRGEGHLLNKSLRTRWARKLVSSLVAVIILIIAFIWPIVGYFRTQRSKAVEPQNEAVPSSQKSGSEDAPLTSGGNIEGTDEAAIAAASASFSPISMTEFFSTAISMSLTSLQRSEFISQHTNRRVIWEGDVATIDESRDKIRVGLTDKKPDMVYIAFFSFPTGHRSDFLALKHGQRIKITGILREWNVTTADLDSSRIIKVWPVQDTSQGNLR
jgi:hypothetical protein